jgi:integrase
MTKESDRPMAHIEDRWARGDRNRLRWRARYIAPDGRERSKSFARKLDAKGWLAAQESAKVTHTWTDPMLGRVLFRDWFAEWQQTTAKLRPHTEARDEHLFRLHVLPHFGAVPLVGITQREVRAWIAGLTAKGLAASTVQRAYQLLSKVMAAAVDAGMLPQTPCRRVPLPKIEREEMRFLTPAEIDRLATKIDQRYRALVLVGAYGGLRFGELAGLRWRAVDLDLGTVEVVEQVTEVRGKLYIGPPKTRASRRRVTLPATVSQALAEHIPPHAAGDAWVFSAPRGGPLRINGFRWRVWRPAIRAAGLHGLRIHDLRHTAVALWIAAGAHPKAVAARAGHTSVSFTLDRYGHLFPDADASLSDRLDQLIRQRSTAPRRPRRAAGRQERSKRTAG